MKITILYDSFFGNTRKVAEAIGAALNQKIDKQVLDVKTIDPGHFEIPDLLVVGSPTRGFRPSPATMDFLKQLPKKSLSGKKVAAFDTRISLDHIKNKVLSFIVHTGGYAAKNIDKQLRKKGGKSIATPEGFCVIDTEGPLLEGEIRKASEWAKNMLNNLN